jgi:subtilisin-like proprotein convertase family protein
VPERGPLDLYWAYEPTEIVIDGLVHPRFTDLVIELVREDLYGQEESWEVLNCTDLADQSGTSTTLAGRYIFSVTGRPDDEAQYPAATTLSTREVCTLASSGEYGNLVPGGIYRPASELIEFQSTPFNDRWFLRITDLSSGAAGFFSDWSLRMKVLPYAEDCNGDGFPDSCFDAFAFDSDCDFNLEADSCQIARDKTADCDVNGVLDVCEDTSFLLDFGGPVWDANGSGALEFGAGGDEDYIVNVLGCADFNSRDVDLCNPNCRPDLCDFIDRPDLDDNQNFIMDCVEGDNIFCAARGFRSADRGLTGPGINFEDLGIVTSSIQVPVEADDGTDNPVVAGATVLGSVKVTIYDLDHSRLSDLQLTLVQESANGVRFTNLLLIGCPGTGYFEIDGGSGTVFSFAASGSETICEKAQSGAVIPSVDPGDETTFYLPVEGTFGAHVGANAAGTWTLESYDGAFGETGSFSGWDLEFVHRPPDNNGNGVPDICEEP